MHGTAKLSRPSIKCMAQLKMHGASQKCMAQLNLQDPAKMHGQAKNVNGAAKILQSYKVLLYSWLSMKQ